MREAFVVRHNTDAGCAHPWRHSKSALVFGPQHRGVVRALSGQSTVSAISAYRNGDKKRALEIAKPLEI